VLRFWNSEVLRQTEGGIEAIVQALRPTRSPRASHPTPTRLLEALPRPQDPALVEPHPPFPPAGGNVFATPVAARGAPQQRLYPTPPAPQQTASCIGRENSITLCERGAAFTLGCPFHMIPPLWLSRATSAGT
jgi:hypothetical protein